eukprot:2772590-Prorocentrum_lima.AAC.1
MVPRLGHVVRRTATMERGVPQGAPESPLLFYHRYGHMLQPLLHRWQAQGRGWRMKGFILR